eukprot:14407800-Alexandrium_andersonii.AAC.1
MCIRDRGEGPPPSGLGGKGGGPAAAARSQSPAPSNRICGLFLRGACQAGSSRPKSHDVASYAAQR